MSKHFLAYLEESIKSYWDKPVMSDIDGDTHLTYATFSKEIYRLHVFFDSIGVHKGDKATIYNVDGKLLLTQTINNNEYILDLNAYAGGLYLIQVLYKHKDTDKQQVISFKIIR